MSNSVPSSSTASNPQPAAEIYQPTVRVMRLYKPGFHLISTLPHVPCVSQSQSTNTSVADFALSPFLLLPDSFGDIYSGEKFSAYIAVVNGFQNNPFYQVTLAIRLQTTSTVIDLSDTRGSASANPAGKTLHCNDASDMIVQHNLTELGIHTLRVSVQYLATPTGETKTLRKFYRFNVLQPLQVTSHFVEVDSKPMIQCQVTNVTKTPLYIEEMNFVPLNQYCTIVDLNKPKRPLTISDEDDEYPDYFADSVRLLQPDESCAYSFMFSKYQTSGSITRSVGHPEIKWCTTMGEFSLFKAEDTLQKGATPTSPALNLSINFNNIKIQCLECPNQVLVGETFDVVLRITNVSPRPIPARLQCLNTTNSGDGYYNSAVAPSAASGNNTPKSPSAAQAPTAAAVQAACLGLCVTGLTYVAIGKIESGEFVDTTISVYALCAGLHDLVGVYVVDAITKQRYSNDSLCKVFVVDDDAEQLTAEEASREAQLQQERALQLQQEQREQHERESSEIITRQRLMSEDKRFKEDERRKELVRLEQIKREEQRVAQQLLEEAQKWEALAAAEKTPTSSGEGVDAAAGDETGKGAADEDLLEVQETAASHALAPQEEGGYEGSLQEESLLEEISNALAASPMLEEVDVASVKGTMSVPESHQDLASLRGLGEVDSSRDVSPYPTAEAADDMV